MAVVVALLAAPLIAIRRCVSFFARVVRRDCYRLARTRGCRACNADMVWSCPNLYNVTSDPGYCILDSLKFKPCADENIYARTFVLRRSSDCRRNNKAVNHLQQTPTLPLSAVQACDLRPFDL